MKLKWTNETDKKLRDFLETHTLVSGLGNSVMPCSMAAINLALKNRLADSIPSCMSRVIGPWIIRAQDDMPSSLRNSKEWKDLLPLAAATGQELSAERRRLNFLTSLMWNHLLPLMSEQATKGGYGEEWEKMLSNRTTSDAWTAANAAVDAILIPDSTANEAHRAASAAARLIKALEDMRARPRAVRAVDKATIEVCRVFMAVCKVETHWISSLEPVKALRAMIEA